MVDGMIFVVVIILAIIGIRDPVKIKSDCLEKKPDVLNVCFNLQPPFRFP